MGELLPGLVMLREMPAQVSPAAPPWSQSSVTALQLLQPMGQGETGNGRRGDAQMSSVEGFSKIRWPVSSDALGNLAQPEGSGHLQEARRCARPRGSADRALRLPGHPGWLLNEWSNAGFLAIRINILVPLLTGLFLTTQH